MVLLGSGRVDRVEALLRDERFPEVHRRVPAANDGALAHLDQPPLTAAVRAAQQRPLAGAQAWDPKVDTDQGPLVAATLAVWAFLRWEELATPGVWVV